MLGTALTLEEIVRGTPDLPTIPAAALQVMRETASAEANARSVANYIAQDQALTARVLRLSNSAYYGFQRQITSINESVVILGMRAVHNLAVVAATYPWMSRQLRGYGLEPKAMWTHSFAVAAGAELIARTTKRAPEPTVFSAGLLHNIGKVALSVWLESKIEGIVSLALRTNSTFDEVERKVLGYDHAEVGAYLGEQWNLPAELVVAIRYHHNPNAAEPPSPVADCVHIGDFMTMSMGFGLGADGLRYDFCEDTLTRLGLRAEDIDELLGEFIETYERYEQLIEAFDVA